VDSERILVVDDEPINLQFFEAMLGKLGFTVIGASDGEAALDRVRSERPDLIILDNVMPKLTGWDVTRRLKQDEDYAEFRDIPIIMFSAVTDIAHKIEGFELGIDDYITKPFNFSEVLARIKAVLRSRDLYRQLVRRERRLSLIDTLHTSLDYFTAHLRTPFEDLLGEAHALDPEQPDQVREFLARVIADAEQTLAAIDALEEEVSDLKARGEGMKAEEVTLTDLDDRYVKHFNTYRAADLPLDMEAEERVEG